MSTQTSFTNPPDVRLDAFTREYFTGLPVTSDRLLGDASTRSYFRVRGGSASYIAAVYPEPFDAGDFPYVEITRLFAENGLAVPRMDAIRGDIGVILQEDLGDARLQDCLATCGEERLRAWYREATDLIVDIQRLTDAAIAADSVAARVAFDEEKLGWELNYFYRHYFTSYLKRPLDPADEAVLLGEFFALGRRLANAPRVLCHRDYHSRNLMLFENRLYVIDHQDARMGPATYDLVSLVGDPYAALSPEVRREMVDLFWDRHFSAFGTRCYATRREFDDEYRLMMLQRMLKAVGTYTYQAAVRDNPVYLPYIPHAFKMAALALDGILDLPRTRAVVEAGLREAEAASV